MESAELPPLASIPLLQFESPECGPSSLPESPVGFPGEWIESDLRVSSLRLPPPFLDKDSARESFKDFFHFERVLKNRIFIAEKLAKDRATPLPFPHSILAFIKKLYIVLGPPTSNPSISATKRVSVTRTSSSDSLGTSNTCSKALGNNVSKATPWSLINTTTSTRKTLHNHCHSKHSAEGIVVSKYLMCFLLFCVWIFTHLVEVAVLLLQIIYNTLFILRSLFLHITFQTPISKNFRNYTYLCYKQWKVAALVDHQNLRVFDVFLGTLELFILHSMSKEQWLAHGNGNLKPIQLPKVELEETIPSWLYSHSSLSSRQSNCGFSSATSSFEQNSMTSDVSSNPPLSVEELSRTLKRHAKFSLASYGLHTMLYPLPSAFSGVSPAATSLPRRVFGHLGGVDGDKVIHFEVQKSSGGFSQLPYIPQLYLVRDDANKEIVCVFRGTQSLDDLRTDLEASLMDIRLASIVDPAKVEAFQVHGGVLKGAQSLLKREICPLLDKIQEAMQHFPTYSLVFCGHSLGASFASMMAILLSEFCQNSASNDSVWVTKRSGPLPSGRRIQAICFAHPTTVSRELSLWASQGDIPLVISVSLTSDVITRMGLPQVGQIRMVLDRLLKIRNEKGENWALVKLWIKWRRMNEQLLSTRNEKERTHLEALKENFEELAWEVRRKLEDGVCALMIPCGKCYHVDVSKTFDADNNYSIPITDGAGVGLYEVGNPDAFYAMPLLDPNMLSVHFPDQYLDYVEAL